MKRLTLNNSISIISQNSTYFFKYSENPKYFRNVFPVDHIWKEPVSLWHAVIWIVCTGLVGTALYFIHKPYFLLLPLSFQRVGVCISHDGGLEWMIHFCRPPTPTQNPWGQHMFTNPITHWMALMAMRFSVSNSNENVLAASQNQSGSGCDPQTTAFHRHVLKYMLKIIWIWKFSAKHVFFALLQASPLSSAPTSHLLIFIFTYIYITWEDLKTIVFGTPIMF